MTELPDIQNQKPNIEIELDKVGVSEIKIPVKVKRKDGLVEHTLAEFDCFIHLDEKSRGINMSRLPIALFEFKDQPIGYDFFENLSKRILSNNSSDKCYISCKFDYFIEDLAPVSRRIGIVHIPIELHYDYSENRRLLTIIAKTCGTSVCPCSKEISKYGAHNQRCYITCILTYEVKSNQLVWFEDIIEKSQESFSAKIYSVLKREDEKYVTEQGYENAKFVEDICREAFVKITKLVKDIIGENFNLRIIVESDESIHLHKAVAIKQYTNLE